MIFVKILLHSFYVYFFNSMQWNFIIMFFYANAATCKKWGLFQDKKNAFNDVRIYEIKKTLLLYKLCYNKPSYITQHKGISLMLYAVRKEMKLSYGNSKNANG